jgi:transketolase
MNGTPDIAHLESLTRLIRYYILFATTRAGSGHPTSSLSSVELMTGLLFGGTFRFHLDRPDHPNNDRLIFSKGHASPLFYALWAAAGRIKEEDLARYRQFGSPLEGHPTRAFPYAEAATGSLGQGLSIGMGFALNARYLDLLPYRTYVLMGDSEMSEGSLWEAMQLAAHYKLSNLIGIVDVNGLGQRGQTMYGRDVDIYRQRAESFGWRPIVIDGHDLEAVLHAFAEAADDQGEAPIMIIARTLKGRGVPLLEGASGWHGKALDEKQFAAATAALGNVDRTVRGTVSPPRDLMPQPPEPGPAGPAQYQSGTRVATRDAYGLALERIYPRYPEIVALDGEVSDSTRARFFRHAHPDRFFEMYIAEQNMVGVGLGLALRGRVPFVSTFGAFMSRAFDQARMAAYSNGNVKFVGSHAGVATGEDGPSQMALEDLALFRALLESIVLYPCDAMSTDRLVEQMVAHRGVAYLRTTREPTPVIYADHETFPIGGSKVLRSSPDDEATVVAAGITVHEAIKAHDILQGEGRRIRVIDLYSIKPVDQATLVRAAGETGGIVTVEDHYAEGGLGESVASALADAPVRMRILAVRRRPQSGKPGELLDYEGISAPAIVDAVRSIHSGAALASSSSSL